MSIMEVRSVTYSYDGTKNVLDDISVSFEEGKVYAILGPSGCGKTTLLSLLGGLDVPTKGTILFDGTDIRQTGLGAHRSEHVSFIFQNYNLIDYMTPLENAALSATKETAMAALKRLGLTESEIKRNVLKLSGGQQQRVAIARALVANTRVILADEPTGNVDDAMSVEITNILKESAKETGKCVIIVTHSIDLAKEADTVLVLKNGVLQKQRPAELETESN
ncbi:ATP-binding cassette domain-containing protein [Phocea massiliensis]|uniref:ATP-binding cassette domain-containing protein n=1 Tax=Merdimmobilis hominis TaxID=2897707 RepID=A0A938X593_9FIRM|nr:ATP-binding cassette domain-containing protein [Merdimmobilis hominis]MBM6919657.1 ATP-binding cassette domain-containing protein [Merdimmobilis hominis]